MYFKNKKTDKIIQSQKMPKDCIEITEEEYIELAKTAVQKPIVDVNDNGINNTKGGVLGKNKSGTATAEMDAITGNFTSIGGAFIAQDSTGKETARMDGNTGEVTTVTQNKGDKSKKAATTEFVQNEILALPKPGGKVDSVTKADDTIEVDNTDPANPKIKSNVKPGGKVDSVTKSDNSIEVDNTDPANPKIKANLPDMSAYLKTATVNAWGIGFPSSQAAGFTGTTVAQLLAQTVSGGMYLCQTSIMPFTSNWTFIRMAGGADYTFIAVQNNEPPVVNGLWFGQVFANSPTVITWTQVGGGIGFDPTFTTSFSDMSMCTSWMPPVGKIARRRYVSYLFGLRMFSQSLQVFTYPFVFSQLPSYNFGAYDGQNLIASSEGTASMAIAGTTGSMGASLSFSGYTVTIANPDDQIYFMPDNNGRGGFYQLDAPKNSIPISREKHTEMLDELNKKQRLVYIDANIAPDENGGQFKYRDQDTMYDEATKSWIPDPEAIAKQKKQLLINEAINLQSKTDKFEMPSYFNDFSELEQKVLIAWRKDIRKVIKGESEILPEIPDFIKKML